MRGMASGLPALYPVDHVECQYLTLGTGIQSYMKDDLFRGQIPKMLILAMVLTDAYNGAYGKNPFNFQHFNLSFLELKIDGKSIPFQPFKPDFGKKHALREYMSLYQSLNRASTTLPFTYDQYLAGGYVLFALNLTPDLSGLPQHPRQTANLRLNMEFSTPLTSNVTVVLLAVFDGLVFMNVNGQVFADYK